MKLSLHNKELQTSQTLKLVECRKYCMNGFSLGLSDSENNTITIVNFFGPFVNTIMIVGYQFFNAMIINKRNKFVKYCPWS